MAPLPQGRTTAAARPPACCARQIGRRMVSRSSAAARFTPRRRRAPCSQTAQRSRLGIALLSQTGFNLMSYTYAC